MIIHGWTENISREWIKNMTNELLKKEKWNVCVCDWSILAAVGKCKKTIVIIIFTIRVKASVFYELIYVSFLFGLVILRSIASSTLANKF